MRHIKLTLLSLLTLAGCSQILGVGDYEIDPALDGKAGRSAGGTPAAGGNGEDGGNQGSDAGAGALPNGGKSQGGAAGSASGGTAGDGGERPLAEGGAAGGGGEAGAPPEIIPCDSVACCTSKGGKAVGIEMLSDGGFELGYDGTPWTEDSTQGYDAITANDPDDPDKFDSYSGEYFAYLSGVQDETTTIYSEDFQIPADAGWITLTGYRLFQIDKQDEVNEDFALIGFYDTNGDGDPLELPFVWGKPSENVDGWGATTGIWKQFTASWDALSHQDTSRYMAVRGSSDAYPVDTGSNTSASSFLFDSLSLKVFRCVQ